MKAKRWLSLFLTACMLVSMLPATTLFVSAADGANTFTLYEYVSVDHAQWFYTGLSTSDVTGLYAKVTAPSTAPEAGYDAWFMGVRNNNLNYSNDGWLCYYRFAHNSGSTGYHRIAVPDGTALRQTGTGGTAITPNVPYEVEVYLGDTYQSQRTNTTVIDPFLVSNAQVTMDKRNNRCTNLRLLSCSGDWADDGNASAYGWIGDVYEVKLYKDASGEANKNLESDMIRDYVPAMNGEGKTGMLDTVTNTFYPSEGKRDFVVGGAKLTTFRLSEDGKRTFLVDTADALESALGMAESGESIEMTADISANSKFTLPEGVTLNQNGYHLDYGTYTFYEYISTDGGAYFDLGLLSTEVTGVKARLSVSSTLAKNGNNPCDHWFIGGRNKDGGTANDGWFGLFRQTFSGSGASAYGVYRMIVFDGTAIRQPGITVTQVAEADVPYDLNAYAISGKQYLSAGSAAPVENTYPVVNDNAEFELYLGAPGGSVYSAATTYLQWAGRF